MIFKEKAFTVINVESMGVAISRKGPKKSQSLMFAFLDVM